MPDIFSRYYVRDSEGEAIEVYDGDDERLLAHGQAIEIGGYVERLDYITDGQFIIDPDPHDEEV